MTPRSAGQTALITGASSGIGYALSHELAKQGFNTVLVARSTDRLETLAKELREKYQILTTVVPCDLSTPGAAPALVAELQARGLTVDLLVNNAGFGQLEKFSKADWEIQAAMIQLNVATLVHLTRLLLPGMLERKAGKILNLGSTGSFSPVPGMAVYAATKAFVLSFSEALAAELEGTGVTVTALCPGATVTRFAERAQADKTLLFRLVTMQAADVARIGVRALLQGRKRVVAGWLNKLQVAALRFSPRDAVLAVGKRLMQ